MNSPIEESAPDTQALRSDVKETKQVEARGAVPVSCSCASGAAGSVDLGGLEVFGSDWLNIPSTESTGLEMMFPILKQFETLKRNLTQTPTSFSC